MILNKVSFSNINEENIEKSLLILEELRIYLKKLWEEEFETNDLYTKKPL
jgi:hypothetical protein